MTPSESSRPPARANLSATATGPCLLFRACTGEGYVYQVDGRGLTATSLAEATRYPIRPGQESVAWSNPPLTDVSLAAVVPFDMIHVGNGMVHLSWGGRDWQFPADGLHSAARGAALKALAPLPMGGSPFGLGVEIEHPASGAVRKAVISTVFLLPPEMPAPPPAIRASQRPSPHEFISHLELLGLQPGKPKTGTSPGHLTRWTRHFGDREIQVDTGVGSVPSAVRLFENGRILHEEDWTGRPFADLQQGLARWAHALHGTQPDTSAAVAAFQALLTR